MGQRSHRDDLQAAIAQGLVPRGMTKQRPAAHCEGRTDGLHRIVVAAQVPDMFGPAETGIGGNDAGHRHDAYLRARTSQMPGHPGRHLCTAAPPQQGNRTTVLGHISGPDERFCHPAGDGAVVSGYPAVCADEQLEAVADIDERGQVTQPVLFEFPSGCRRPEPRTSPPTDQ